MTSLDNFESASLEMQPVPSSQHDVVTAATLKSASYGSTASAFDPLSTAHGIYVTVHGHFYQPPRENPYLNAIERQPSASPFHNWNERIHYECYRPNAFARVLNDDGNVIGIINNYEYLSFNMGPTLMTWLEHHDPEVYRRILEADRKSCLRLNGHGNAIAQAYNHMILPLANERDKYTQVRWGKADFRHRFGRDPEGMWLAETAVDAATIKVLVEEGIRFIVLAPSQAERCRPLATEQQPNPQWLEVGGGQIDPIQPYRCFLPGGDRTKDFIDIFFYDGPISRDMGFNDVLSSSGHFIGRLGQAVRGDHRQSQLISVATDGETFGHHKGGTEKALAYAFVSEFPNRNWTVTNYAHYLSICPPQWEVELKPVTAWSCSHGVNRWQDDCGCGGGGVWHQKWRRPLRDSLNWLRDQLIQIYDEHGKQFFNDPWKARDEYISVVLDRSLSTINAFLTDHQNHKLTPQERTDALRLLEMQRHAMLMYTSCGWFFEEVSRPEGTQILRYASRALELAGDVAGVQLEREFIKRLETIPSNVEVFGHGAEVYRQLVQPAQISLEQVAAHYAISSLFTAYDREQRIYCYIAHQIDYQLQRIGSLALAVGQLVLTSEITREAVNYEFAVLHVGGWDFHCCIKPFEGRRSYSQLKEALFGSLKQASAAQTILAMVREFGDQSFSLQELFAEERHRLMRLLSQETLTRLDQLYTQVYRDNYGVLMAFHRDELDVPQELQVAAEIAIGHRAMASLQALEQETSDFPFSNPQVCMTHLAELEAIATEANHLHCHLNLPQGREILERLVWRSLWNIFDQFNPDTITGDVQWIKRLIQLGQALKLHPSLAKSQELFVKGLRMKVLPQMMLWQQAANAAERGETEALTRPSDCWELDHIYAVLELGEPLAVDVDLLRDQLPE